MFLPQPSTMVTIFTGMNYSLPIHKAMVVTETDLPLHFCMAPMVDTKEWVFEVFKIDKINGEMTLRDGWKKKIWKHPHKLKQKGKEASHSF